MRVADFLHCKETNVSNAETARNTRGTKLWRRRVDSCALHFFPAGQNGLSKTPYYDYFLKEMLSVGKGKKL